MLIKRFRVYYWLTNKPNVVNVDYVKDKNEIHASDDVWEYILKVQPFAGAYRHKGEPQWKALKNIFQTRACEETKNLTDGYVKPLPPNGLEEWMELDTTACLCRVDAGLKIIVGAKEYVPGTKLCFQPDIKPSIHPTRQKLTRGRNTIQSPLLPGLPDDLVIACLIHVLRIEHFKLRLVCKRWHHILADNFFYSLLKNLGIAKEWIYVIKRDRDGKLSRHAFDPIYQLWQPLPPVPREYSEVFDFGCAVLSGCHLYLFGGKDPVKGPMRRDVFYSASTNKWHRARDMLRRRHFFGCCVIKNCLYVAGGESEGSHRSLRSAEVYDPNKNKWSFISDMSTAMVPYIGVVYQGKWFLKGLGSHRQVLSEVYQPEVVAPGYKKRTGVPQSVRMEAGGQKSTENTQEIDMEYIQYNY
ncbi:hypothetical protein BUALT_Bualt12G0097700 [Buddleja alternifolia]|uniref:F-box domain-containing protein n=1 Tax=Buddleja alternifolia TaxID=168488 RepID=A0AAV6X0P2_9LAMI|nr:hypothetical protein BUALT_Bualt12G0097700 [Buddleja alternifolia]